MAAEDVLAEALARLEHKVDLLLDLMARTMGPGSTGFMLPPVGDPQHICPVCTQNVQHQIDIMKKVVVRKCGCGTGKLAPINMDQFAPPTTVKETFHHGEPGIQEDGVDSDSGGGRRTRPR